MVSIISSIRGAYHLVVDGVNSSGADEDLEGKQKSSIHPTHFDIRYSCCRKEAEKVGSTDTNRSTQRQGYRCVTGLVFVGITVFADPIGESKEEQLPGNQLSIGMVTQ